jgi:hypothetical protein
LRSLELASSGYTMTVGTIVNAGAAATKKTDRHAKTASR